MATRLIRSGLILSGNIKIAKRNASCWFQSYLVRNLSSNIQHIFKSPYPDMPLLNLPLQKYIWQNMNRWPNHVAIECVLSGKKYTFNEIYLKSKKFGATLKHLGFAVGDRLGIFLPNIPDYPIVYFGSLHIGLEVNTMDSNIVKGELCRQIKDTDTKCLVCHPSNLHVVMEAINEMKRDICVICTNNLDGTRPTKSERTILFEDAISDNVDESVLSEPNVNLNDTVLISYSSGTTGIPKGVCLTHSSIVNNFAQRYYEAINPYVTPEGDNQTVIPGFLPFSHVYGFIVVLLSALASGCKVITFPKFDTATFIKVVSTSKNMCLMIVPSLIPLIMNSPHLTARNMRGITQIVTGAAPIGPQDMEKIRSKTKAPIAQGYGMTESTAVLTYHSDAKCNISSIGKLLPNTKCKIIDIDTGESLPVNSAGNLCFQGPQIMKGYLNNPEATAKTIDSDGWLISGDFGYCDENGYFYIIDRLKDIIKVNGFQVSPSELEAVLRGHPDIMDAGVIGVPCPKAGEKPVAFVQLNPNSKTSADDLKTFISARLSKNKQPSDIKLLESIPKTASGKVLRKELKHLL